jgi:hypothetical protein
MRQAITVKFHGPTNTDGARWTARAAAGSRTVGQDYAMGSAANAEAAALALCAKMGWQCELIGGQAHDGSYVFVRQEG